MTRAQLLQEIRRTRRFIRILLFRMRMNQVQPEPAEEQFADETRVLPLGLARLFSCFASLTLAGEGL